MQLPQAAPGEGRGDDHLRFTFWKGITGGQRHSAYIAGPAKWFICHPSDKGTKPCLHWMTKGALPCRFCAASKTPEEGGYVPLWRQVDWAPMIVFVYGDEREHVDRLEHHNKVLIGREVGKGARLWVRLATNQEPPFNTTDPRKKVARDITSSLLIMWKMPELIAWLQSSDNAVSLPKGTAVKESGKPFAPHMQAAAKRNGAKVVPPVGAADAVNEVMHRFKGNMEALKPSANGNHKPSE